MGPEGGYKFVTFVVMNVFLLKSNVSQYTMEKSGASPDATFLCSEKKGITLPDHNAKCSKHHLSMQFQAT